MLARTGVLFLSLAVLAALTGSVTEIPDTRADERHGVRTDDETSLNWAGYASDDGEHTGVSGTWTVTEAHPVGRQAAYATWVGIGGVHSSDLIQAGTAAVENYLGDIEYFAWFETLPAAAVPVPVEIAVGDSVTVHVREEEENEWLISIINNTTGEELHIPMYYESTRSSAEWIQERPMIGNDEFTSLSGFDSFEFTDATTIKNGKEMTIAEAGAHRIAMTDLGGSALAVPTVLGDDGRSFAVSRTDTGIGTRAITARVEREEARIRVIVSIGGYEAAFPLRVIDLAWPLQDLFARS